MEGLKDKAKAKGLWNFFLTDSESGSGLNTVEYAYLAEEMGKSHMAAEVFNCCRPRYWQHGSAAQVRYRGPEEAVA